MTNPNVSSNRVPFFEDVQLPEEPTPASAQETLQVPVAPERIGQTLLDYGDFAD